MRVDIWRLGVCGGDILPRGGVSSLFEGARQSEVSDKDQLETVSPIY